MELNKVKLTKTKCFEGGQAFDYLNYLKIYRRVKDLMFYALSQVKFEINKNATKNKNASLKCFDEKSHVQRMTLN